MSSPVIYENPVILWLPEVHLEWPPLTEPPPGPFTVTRSEIVIRPQTAPVVHIWFAVVPAVPG